MRRRRCFETRFFLLLLLVVVHHVVTGKYLKPTVYQKIRQSAKLTQFYNLLESNRPAKLNLQYGEMTVFVPTNEAFEWYSGRNLNDLINYHMAWYARTLTDLENGPLSTVMDENPPVWVTKLEDDTFVNNARIIPEASDYVSEINSEPRKPQVLHVVDEVLDPVVRRTSLGVFSPTALDLMSRSQFWDLNGHKVGQFHRKVVLSRKDALFKSEGNYTFFVPVDDGFTDYRLQMVDGNVIDAHVVPGRVLFTRPTPKDLPFETLANGDYLYVVVLFSGTEGQLYIKSHTLVGDSNRPNGEIASEIVKANIPVRNGVVHLIKRPLAVFDRRLTLFPYLPVADKFSMDPTLDRSHSLAESTGFNAYMAGEREAGRKFTFFVPRDEAWEKLRDGLGVNKTYMEGFVRTYGRSILSRHLVVSNVSYTVEDLRRKSNVSDTADVDLRTAGGLLRIGIGDYQDGFIIYWRNKMVPIHRPNYYCADGIVHVVDDVFVTEEDLVAADSRENVDVNPFSVINVLMHLTL